jgi:hypothetical protein
MSSVHYYDNYSLSHIFFLKPFKVEAYLNVCNNSVRTAKKTQHFTITKINWLTLFKEIIAVYIENHMKPIHTIYSITNFKAGGTYSYHWALKG